MSLHISPKLVCVCVEGTLDLLPLFLGDVMSTKTLLFVGCTLIETTFHFKFYLMSETCTSHFKEDETNNSRIKEHLSLHRYPNKEIKANSNIIF